MKWWMPSLLMLVAAGYVALYGATKPKRGDYDMVTGLRELAIALALVVGAVCIGIGHFI